MLFMRERECSLTGREAVDLQLVIIQASICWIRDADPGLQRKQTVKSHQHCETRKKKMEKLHTFLSLRRNVSMLTRGQVIESDRPCFVMVRDLDPPIHQIFTHF